MSHCFRDEKPRNVALRPDKCISASIEGKKMKQTKKNTLRNRMGINSLLLQAILVTTISCLHHNINPITQLSGPIQQYFYIEDLAPDSWNLKDTLVIGFCCCCCSCCCYDKVMTKSNLRKKSLFHFSGYIYSLTERSQGLRLKHKSSDTGLLPDSL